MYKVLNPAFKIKETEYTVELTDGQNRTVTPQNPP